VKNVPRHRRSPASFLRVLCRSVSRKVASVPPGTPAAAFVALGTPRPDFVQRHSELLRGVALRPVASACGNSPRNTLLRVLANLRRTARRKLFERISERFAGQGPRGLGGTAVPTVPQYSVSQGGSPARKVK
jgi:hypothetical protein